MGLRSLVRDAAEKWQAASKHADDMGIPPVDHILGISLPGLTHRLDEDDISLPAKLSGTGECDGTEHSLQVEERK